MNTRPERFQISLLSCLALVLVGLGWGFGRSDARHTTRPAPAPIGPAASESVTVSIPSLSPEPDPARLGRIRSRFELVEAESPLPFHPVLPGAEVRKPSDLEAFFARHIDPLFHRTGGWQIYNPDRLDRGQESARSTSLAFAAGLRYRHSF